MRRALTLACIAGCASASWTDLAAVTGASPDREYPGAVTVYLGEGARDVLAGQATQGAARELGPLDAPLAPTVFRSENGDDFVLSPGAHVSFRVTGLHVALPPEAPEPRVAVDVLISELSAPLIGLTEECALQVPVQTATVTVAFDLSRDLAGRIKAVCRAPASQVADTAAATLSGCGSAPVSPPEPSAALRDALVKRLVGDVRLAAWVLAAIGGDLTGASVTAHPDGSRLDVRLTSSPGPDDAPPAVFGMGVTALPLTLAIAVTPSPCATGLPPEWPPVTPAAAYTPVLDSAERAWSVALRRDGLNALLRASARTAAWCGAALTPMGPAALWRDVVPKELADDVPIHGRLLVSAPWSLALPEGDGSQASLSTTDVLLEIFASAEGVSVAVARFQGDFTLSALNVVARPDGSIGLDGGLPGLSGAPVAAASFLHELVAQLTHELTLLQLPPALRSMGGPLIVESTPDSVVISASLAPHALAQRGGALEAGQGAKAPAPSGACTAQLGGRPVAGSGGWPAIAVLALVLVWRARVRSAATNTEQIQRPRSQGHPVARPRGPR